MIVAKNLTKYFEDFLAVDGVSLEVGTGEVLALLGPNGAGKTTTVRMLTSILKPSSGWATVAGHDVVAEAQQVRASVGVLTEHHGLYNRMPADEYLDFFGQVYGLEKEFRGQRIEKLLSDFNLSDSTDRRVGEFSKGMRQKLALARAMIHNPQVLLLDEPTSAMDPESARLVRDSIKELRSEARAVVICTHNLAEAEDLADRIAIIRRGQIIANDSPAALKRKLLGPKVYEVTLSSELDGYRPQLPGEVEVLETGENWLRFRTPDPNNLNPVVLRKLLEQDFPVLSLQEVPRSLEQVYLQAVVSEEGAGDVE
ncbi:ABC transporter ATP-binding protein [Chloroflexota bacterium]